MNLFITLPPQFNCSGFYHTALLSSALTVGYRGVVLNLVLPSQVALELRSITFASFVSHKGTGTLSYLYKSSGRHFTDWSDLLTVSPDPGELRETQTHPPTLVCTWPRFQEAV